MKPRRLDQILANFGYCSRSEAKRWIRAGRVTVAGRVTEAPEDTADATTVLGAGEAIECPERDVGVFRKQRG